MYNVFPLNQNLCAKKPCLNNGKCSMGYTEKKYVVFARLATTEKTVKKVNSILIIKVHSFL